MYTFERQGRPLAHAAPRGHRVGAAGRARARPAPRRPAGEALVLRAATTATSARRPAATGTSPRSASRRSGVDDPALDAETDRCSPSTATADLGLREVQLLLNSLGDKACRPAYRERAAGLPARPGPRRRRPAAGSSSTRCGCSTTSGRTSRRQLVGAPLVRRPPLRGLQGAPRAGAALLTAAGVGVRATTPTPGPRPRLLHAHHLRVRARRARCPVGCRRRRPLRRAVGVDRRPRAARCRLGARRRPHRARPARPRASTAPGRPGATSSPCRSGPRPGAVLFDAVSRAARGPACAPTSPTAAGASRAR